MAKKKEWQACLKNIFIISSVANIRSLKPAIHFFQQQKYLESIGFTVVNPIEMWCDKDEMSYNYNSSTNLKKLFDCKWVCIMPEVSLENSRNTELLISLALDLIMIQAAILEIDLEITEEEELLCMEIKD